MTETTQLRAMPMMLVTAQAGRLLFCSPSSSLDGSGKVAWAFRGQSDLQMLGTASL